MKAHRRKGIPTLMLQTGGSPKLGGPLGRRLLSESQEERRGLASGLTQALEDRDNLLQRNFRFGPQDQPDTETQLARDIRTVGGIIDPVTVIPRGLGGLYRFYDKNIARPFAEYARKEVPTPSAIEKAAEQSAQAEAEAQANAQADLARTQAQRAADALSGGVRRPPTTPVEKAKAAQAEQAAETAEAYKAAASVSSPEEEALRRATGAPSSAEEAAAAAKSGDLSREASPVQGKDGTTIASIMGSVDAQFNEQERLNELKTTFGLNLSDMEKAAPGIAFSLSLMGAQRAPGESVFNALARSAGSAGEGALKAKLALDAKERAIDSSLVSTVLGEKKVAEDYVKNTMWVVSWDGGFDKKGSPGASFYRMNARQLNEATEAGLPIVPMDFLKSSMTAESARAAYRSKEGATIQAALVRRIGEAYKPTSVKMTLVTRPKDKVDGRRLIGFDENNEQREVVLPDDVGGNAKLVGNILKDSGETLLLVDEMNGLIDKSAGAFNVASALSEKTMSLLGLGKNATAQDLYRAASEKGSVALNNLSGFAKGKVNVDNAYNEMGADGVKKFLNIQGDISEEDLKKRLSENLNNVRGSKPIEKPGQNASDEDLSSYEARVRFRTIQNALAAKLAPILLGESGRTISDADRVRVIALLGGFADFSKAGVFTSAEEMRQSTAMLKEILGKYEETALQDSNAIIDAYDEASTYTSPITKGRLYSPSKSDEKAVGDLRVYVQAFDKKKAGQTSQPASSTVSAAVLLGSP